MKLARLGEPGHERPAVLIAEGRYVDVSDVVDDIDGALLTQGPSAVLGEVIDARVAKGDVHAIGDRRVGAPIPRPHQIVCVGLNYSDHAAETGQPVPSEPILFTKSPNSLVGPRDDIVRPRGATKLDWEVELGLVIGRPTYQLDTDDEARAAIAGYTLVHDVSEREFQLERGGQWLKGKSAPTFTPTGPWLATRDELGDADDLHMWLDVDGVRRQDGSTATMIFRPAFIVRYISQFMALEPGDLVITGTPPGVGMGFTPPVWLEDGAVVELGIDGLGSQRSRIVGSGEGTA